MIALAPADTCWCLRFDLSYRDVEELLAERGVEVDHDSIYRWVQRFTPLLARPELCTRILSIHEARLSADHPNHHSSRENLTEVCTALGTAVVKCEWAADGQQLPVGEIESGAREP